MSKVSWESALSLERSVSLLIKEQEETGVFFNIAKANYFLSLLERLKEEQYSIIRPYLKPIIVCLEKPNQFEEYSYVKKLKTIKGIWNKQILKHYPNDLDIVEGPFSRIEIEEPSISKRALIVDRLLDLGWKPSLFTEKGFPKLTHEGLPVETLETVGDFGKALSLWYVYNHRQSQIAGFTKHVRVNQRIPAKMDTCGTNTFRCTHKIVANIPRPSSIFGKEMRSLFTVEKGRVFVGTDAAGLELRMLAHYMNDPEYTHQILSGDIHEYNKVKAGLPTRDNAKSFIYAFL